jgi:fused signal recognition particle receptor
MSRFPAIAMSFNWFDRNAANPEAAAAAPSTVPSDQPQAADTPTSEEMLTFAKQAYENLKKQKAAEAGEGAVAKTPEAETPAVETPEAETPAEKPEIYSPPPDDSGLPFWARADADREIRLARLRETAIETAEPNAIETEAPRVRREIDPATLVPLDGDFLWSMEVLASQGRRADEVTLEEITWLKQLRQGLDRTRRSLVNQLKAIVGQGPLNDDAVMEIESLLLQADVGVAATDRIIGALQGKLKQEVLPPDKAIAYLKEQLINLLDEPIKNQATKVFVPEKDQLNIWLLTGVNGVGKTTTIGKLTHIATKSGYRCLIAAADTFRAAAVEQVKVWGARSGVDVIANPGQNTDPASVVFDAIAAAQSRNTELLLVDTAGRLQNKKNLMDELSKVRRIIDKKAPDAKIESLLVLDATLGQNGLQQAKVFAEAAQLSGVVLTKLDGTAKGGIALAVVQQLGLPIRFIGAGEGIEDLRPFSSYEFVEALISG